MFDHLGNAADVRRNDWFAGCHRFEKHDGEALPPGGQDEDVDEGIETLRIGDLSEQANSIGQSGLGNLPFELVAKLSVAGDEDNRLGPRPDDAPGRANQRRMILLID